MGCIASRICAITSIWDGMVWDRHSMNGIDIVWYGIDMDTCTPLPALTHSQESTYTIRQTNRTKTYAKRAQNKSIQTHGMVYKSTGEMVWYIRAQERGNQWQSQRESQIYKFIII